ncbi:MAG: asparaginase [Planctomycetota bacterium]|nr:MAG: asparaginase [Planctomycetota bacterium]
MTSAAVSAPSASLPEQPVLVRLWRGEHVESQHRGAWVVVDAGGVQDGVGQWNAPVFARSSVKSLQALPLLESGAADRFGYDAAELALALSSHSAEPIHTERVAALLGRLGLGVEHLRCGPQQPLDPAARRALAERGAKPSALHNNCSGKHAGFLALARHLGVDPAAYLDPAGASQRAVRNALQEITGTEEGELYVAVDGCSAPTFRLPLVKLAAGVARIANPAAQSGARAAACERMLAAVAQHPELIAGTHQRICTDIARATRGRLFPKIGAEGIYVIGRAGTGQGLALKIDDGNDRALHALVVALLEKLGWADAQELAALARYRETPLVNRAGLVVGRTEVLV